MRILCHLAQFFLFRLKFQGIPVFFEFFRIDRLLRVLAIALSLPLRLHAIYVPSITLHALFLNQLTHLPYLPQALALPLQTFPFDLLRRHRTSLVIFWISAAIYFLVHYSQGGLILIINIFHIEIKVGKN